ncbi:MAG TPA: YihY/virulence factor BrkB family protein [Pyrinomonadaceae bacterium]|nr:YihY/virulence factor BrkB family protein [Pyrinomonadaceae bacterium]
MKIFGKDEWKEFFGRLYEKVNATDIFNRAAEVAFFFSFAFFPLLLFLVTLAGIVLGSTESLKRELYSYLFQILPVTAFDLVQQTLEEIIESSSGGKLTIGIFITLWSASVGVDTLRNSLNSVYQLTESRPWWKTKLQSLVLTFIFILLLVIALITVSSGWAFFQHLLALAGIEIGSSLVVIVVQWLALLLVLWLASEFIYNWLPCHRKFRWYWITVGSVVAIGLWIIFSAGFRTYLQYFNTYNRAYGSLGAVIILMLWMYLSGLSIMIGGAINSVLREMELKQEGRTISAGKQESECDAD